MPIHPPRLWTPLVFSPDDLKARDNHYINMVIARLKPGMTIRAAQTDMDSIAERLATAYPDTNKHRGVSVLTVQEYLIRRAQARPVMMMMLAMVGLVLLMACANIAGLLLSRGAVRAHEMAVRVAIGARRGRLIGQMLTESLLMGIVGGAAGLILSIWGIRLLRAGFNFNVYGTQQGQHIHLDNWTLLFTLALSVFSAIMFGLAPAFRGSKVNLGRALNEGGRTGSENLSRSRLRSILVSSEIALAILLLASASILLREMIREFSQPLGFNSHHLVIADLHLEGRLWVANCYFSHDSSGSPSCCYHSSMRHLVVLFVHFLTIMARLLGPGSVRSLVAESLLLKHQLLIVNRSRHRSPNLSPWDRILVGWMALLVRPTRLLRSAIVLKPSTLLGLHRAMTKRKYRMLFSSKRRRKPDPKGPSVELVHAVVEMKQLNPNWGCPRIAQQIALAFHIQIDKDVVRRILGSHHRPGQNSGGPSWLTFLGHLKDSLWSIDLFRVRIGYVADPLGPGGHGSIHAPDHWVRRPSGHARWCRTLSDIQPRHSRSTLVAEVSQLR